ncbi:MAG: hypothetical protein M3198_15445 [Actinomycetota bacterium]|nr:hypothetical protein [Actinomycetota bacterium]
MYVFKGVIAGAAFAQGHRFVMGVWHESPAGPIADVMWAKPDGSRTLLASTEWAADFVSHHYHFDDVSATELLSEVDDGSLRIKGGDIHLHLSLGPPGVASRLLQLRPKWLQRRPAWITLENGLLRPLAVPLVFGGGKGIKLRGRTRVGARQWYGIQDYRPVLNGGATVAGADLGALGAALNPAAFGFSEFPKKASALWVTSLIEETG